MGGVWTKEDSGPSWGIVMSLLAGTRSPGGEASWKTAKRRHQESSEVRALVEGTRVSAAEVS